MEVLDSKVNKPDVVPIPSGEATGKETRTEKAFRTQKLSFLAGMSFLQKVQDNMSGIMDQGAISISVSQPFAVRTERGWIYAHCASCYRAKFVTEVPA